MTTITSIEPIGLTAYTDDAGTVALEPMSHATRVREALFAAPVRPSRAQIIAVDVRFVWNEDHGDDVPAHTVFLTPDLSVSEVERQLTAARDAIDVALQAYQQARA